MQVRVSPHDKDIFEAAATLSRENFSSWVRRWLMKGAREAFREAGKGDPWEEPPKQ